MIGITTIKKTLTFGLTHIAIAVKNLHITKTFYQAVFDMEVMYEEAEFIQLTPPGTHDILVFEEKKRQTKNLVALLILALGFVTPKVF